MIMKTLSAVALATAVLSTPVFAQDEAGSQKTVHALHHYRSSYNQVQGPVFVAPRGSDDFNAQNSFDRSRIGDHDPDFNPSGS